MGFIDLNDEPVTLTWSIDNMDLLADLKLKSLEKVYGVNWFCHAVFSTLL